MISFSSVSEHDAFFYHDFTNILSRLSPSNSSDLLRHHLPAALNHDVTRHDLTTGLYSAHGSRTFLFLGLFLASTSFLTGFYHYNGLPH